MHELPATLKLITVWLLLGLGVFLGVQAWEAQRLRPRVELAIGGDTIELRRGPDGHYHWPGRVNGRLVDFLVDTGATTTALPRALADELGLPVLRTVRSSTANGLVAGSLSRADLALDGGVQIANAQVIVLPALSAPLLGMNVLSKLSWRHAGDRLIVQPLDRAD